MIVYKKHFAKIDRAKELLKICKDYKESSNEITPKCWKEEGAKFQNNKKLYNWKIDQLRDELGRVESNKKLFHEMILVEHTKQRTTKR